MRDVLSQTMLAMVYESPSSSSWRKKRTKVCGILEVEESLDGSNVVALIVKDERDTVVLKRIVKSVESSSNNLILRGYDYKEYQRCLRYKTSIGKVSTFTDLSADDSVQDALHICNVFSSVSSKAVLPRKDEKKDSEKRILDTSTLSDRLAALRTTDGLCHDEGKKDSEKRILDTNSLSDRLAALRTGSATVDLESLSARLDALGGTTTTSNLQHSEDPVEMIIAQAQDEVRLDLCNCLVKNK